MRYISVIPYTPLATTYCNLWWTGIIVPNIVYYIEVKWQQICLVCETCWCTAVAERARSVIGTGAASLSRYIETAGDKLEQRYAPADNPTQLDPKTKERSVCCFVSCFLTVWCLHIWWGLAELIANYRQSHRQSACSFAQLSWYFVQHLLYLLHNTMHTNLCNVSSLWHGSLPHAVDSML